AVIAAEWHLAQLRHFAIPHLVQDLARLGIGSGVHFRRLVGREMEQHASRDIWVDPERLERGDERVPPENRAEPWNAGIRVWTCRRVGHRHIKVREAASQALVEALVGGDDGGRT